MLEFFFQHKKTFYIIGFCLLVIGIGVFMYFILWRPYIGPKPAGVNEAVETGRLPVLENGNVNRQIAANANAALPEITNLNANVSALVNGSVAVSQYPEIAAGGPTLALSVGPTFAQKPTLAANGRDLQYYNQTDGKFYRIPAEGGDPVLLSDVEFPQVKTVTWAPSSEKAIIEFPDERKIMYDFNQGKQASLPQYWQDFSFSPNSDNIVTKSLSSDPENSWLIRANADGSQAKRLEPLGENEQYVQVAWSPNNQIAAFYNEGLDLDRREVYFVGFNSENFRSTTVHGYDFRAKWAPRGDKIVYSVYDPEDNYLPKLWVVNAQGEAIGSGQIDLGVNTWVEKCTFSKDNVYVYCGVPNGLPRGAGLIPTVADNVPDTIYKIDTRSGMKTLVANPISYIGRSNYTIDQIFLTRDENYLFFTDKQHGGLHRIRLK